MKLKTNNKGENICLSCDRIILGESKTGLCPACVDKYGTPAALIALVPAGFGLRKILRLAWSNKGEIIKVATNLIKRGQITLKHKAKNIEQIIKGDKHYGTS